MRVGELGDPVSPLTERTSSLPILLCFNTSRFPPLYVLADDDLPNTIMKQGRSPMQALQLLVSCLCSRSVICLTFIHPFQLG